MKNAIHSEDEYREVLTLILGNARYYPGDEKNRAVIDVAVLDRVREAMSEYNPVKPSTQTKIIRELHRIIGDMGGGSMILSITGSYRDTLTDAEVLDLLKGYRNTPYNNPESIVEAMRRAAVKSLHASHNGNGGCIVCKGTGGEHERGCPMIPVIDISLMTIDFELHGRVYLENKRG